MKTCKYTFKQKDANGEDASIEFENELDFLDFIISNQRHLLKDDIVFSDGIVATNNPVRDAKLAQLFDIIKNTRHLEKNLSKDEQDELNRELETHSVSGVNIIGVTKFLQGLHNAYGKLLFPEFRDENFWSTTQKRWEDPNAYTEEELEILFEKNPDGIYQVDQNIPFEAKRAKIEERWRAQAAAGTNIHRVMQIFFSYNRKDDVKQMFRKTDDEIVKAVLNDPEFNVQVTDEVSVRQLIAFGRQIIEKFGEKANYFPEFRVSAKTSLTNEKGDQQTLLGVIDLLILDENGNTHVIDYKTSPVDYINYPDAKKLTFKYQMATYSRLLNINGISDAGTSVYVAPIKLNNFRKENGAWVHDGISTQEKLFESITILSDVNMQNNLDDFLPQPVQINVIPEKVLSGEKEFMEKNFAKLGYGKEYTDKDIQEIMKGKVTFNEDTQRYVYKANKSSSPISAKTEEQLHETVKKSYNNATKRRRDLTVELKNRLNETLSSVGEEESTLNIESFTSKLKDSEYGNINWLNRTFSKYFNGQWEVYEGDEALNYLGVIILQNKLTGQTNIIRISTQNLTEKVKLNKGKYITGHFQADIVEDQKPNSLMLEAIQANVEYMDTMYIMNQYTGLFKEQTIGEILVVNPLDNEAIPATNEQLKYTWDALHKLNPMCENRFSSKNSDTIKLAKYWDICLHTFQEIMGNELLPAKVRNRWETFKPVLDKLSQFDHNEYDSISQKRDLLVKLKQDMETVWPGIEYQKSYDPDRNPEVSLYQAVVLAIGEASDIKLRQTYQDRKNLMESPKFWKDGMQGLETDNPGNLAEENLNNITKLVMRAYQNVKDSLSRYQPTVEKQLKKFKEASGFSLLKERTIGNQASLYQNMIWQDDSGNLLLKNPWKNDHPSPLKSHEIEFLKFFLTEINKDRKPYLSGVALEEARQDSQGEYFYLPLAKGDAKSSIAVKGLLPALKDRVMRLSPKNIKKEVRESVEGFFSDEEKSRIEEGSLFHMTNTFNKGYSAQRLDFIAEQEEGKAFFETNLETLLLKHKFAYVTQKHMDEVFPDIQAILMHLTVSAATQNTNYPHLVAYVENYIKSKIFNKNIDDETFDTLNAYGKKAMAAASWLALAFNPRQLYQGIEGIWKDVSLFIRKPDGTYNFSFGNLKDSFLSTLPEIIDMSQGISKWEALNRLYGINDMDMNTYIDRIKSDNSGIYGAFTRLSYMFASRPDFYNRATIFGAQMRGDGCWDAHIMKDGNLIYDMGLDERFKEFWAVETGKATITDQTKYNNQKALYIAMAKQMEIERVRNVDGSLFKMRNEDGSFNALPKAYTIQQSDGYKDVADSIYGYYSHEKKALIQSHGIGALIMQMNTYWSAKKNQYLAPGSIKLQGKMQHYSEKRKDENGNEREVFYYIDENGDIFDGDEMEQTGRKGIPYYTWRGQFQEGIIITMANILNFTNGTFKERWMQIYNNPDEELRRAYRANLGQLFYDLYMYLIMGQLLAGGLQKNAKEYIKGSNNPFANLTVDYSTTIFKQSFVDFNALESIFGRGANWTPFAISKLGGLVSSWSNVVVGNGSAKTALLNSMGVTRTLKPLFETVN